jgi:hypothetical protein
MHMNRLIYITVPLLVAMAVFKSSGHEAAGKQNRLQQI